jgi:hypothetical protein
MAILVVKLSSGNTSASSYSTIHLFSLHGYCGRHVSTHLINPSASLSLLPNRITPSPLMQPCPCPQTCVRSYSPWHPMLVAMPRPYTPCTLRPAMTCSAAERRSNTWRRPDGDGTITTPRATVRTSRARPPCFGCTIAALEIRRARRRRQDWVARGERLSWRLAGIDRCRTGLPVPRYGFSP